MTDPGPQSSADFGALVGLTSVLCAYLVAALGSYAALEVIERRREASTSRGRTVWLTVGAAAMGLGVWASHGIGLMAGADALLPDLHPFATPWSALAAFLAAGAALHVMHGAGFGFVRTNVAAFFMAIAIAGVHFIDTVDYSLLHLGLPLAIAHVLAAGAIILHDSPAIRSDPYAIRPRILSGLTMGAAVVAAHYAAVATSEVVATPFADASDDGSFRFLAGALIGVATAWVAAMAVVGTVIDRHMKSEHRRRVLAENARDETESRYRGLVENSPDGVVLHADERVVYANPAIARMLGLSGPEKLLGRWIFDFVHPDFATVARRRVDSALEAGTVLPLLEEKIVSADGEAVAVEMTGVRTTFEGKPATQLVVRDIRPRKQMEQIRDRLIAILDATPDMVGIADPNLVPIYVNPAGRRLVGIAPDADVTHTTLLDYFPEWVVEFLRAEALPAAVREGSWQGEVAIRGANGEEIPASQVIIAHKGADGSVAVYSSILRDIHELRQTKQDLRRALDDALSASQLKSAFLSNISHEIRTPLNVILGYTSLVRDDLPEDLRTGFGTLFAGIDRAGARLLSTVGSVLDLSRITSGTYPVEPGKIHPSAIVAEVASRYREEAEEKGLAFDLVPGGEEAVFFVDSSCIQKALENLVDNAIKFTSHGRVAVRCAANESGDFRIEVEDTGVGFDESYLRHLFEPFTQEEAGMTRKFEGAGVGLSVAYGLMRLVGGELSIESRKGVGSTCRIRLPARLAIEGEAAPRESEAVEEPKHPREQSLVLLVEDDPMNQDFVRRALTGVGRVIVAGNAAEARRHLENESHNIDVVLMDLSLGGGEDGLSLTRAIRENPEWKHLRVIAVTAHAQAGDRESAFQAGCDDYLSKPFLPKQLRALLARESVRHPGESRGPESAEAT